MCQIERQNRLKYFKWLYSNYESNNSFGLCAVLNSKGGNYFYNILQALQHFVYHFYKHSPYFKRDWRGQSWPGQFGILGCI